jgi:D-3-phosphoglycerate dehydrogenase
VIARHGVGVDMVDCGVATARRIPIVNTPEANTNAVAEHAVALLMACAKELAPASIAVLSGNFSERLNIKGVELAGKTLGLIGLGRIGHRVAQIAFGGFGMKVYAYDPLVDGDAYDGPATIESSLEALLGRSDFLSVHVPLIEETRNLLNEERLQQLKPGCCVINTARGGVIDEAALVRALESGAVSAAGIDVFENEPVAADDPLCTAPNTFLTPHTATSTREALDNMSRDAAQGVLDVLQGRRPRWVVNPEVL